MEEKYYVYVWYNDDADVPFYVGKGCGDRYKRAQKSHRSQYFWNVYNKHHCHSEIIIDHLSEKEAFEKEIETIKQLKEKGFTLVNHTDGGEGSTGRIITEEYREKYRKMNSGEGNPNYGNKWSNEQKEHLSQVRKEKQLARYGNNPRALPVMCVETGKIYSCQQEATDDLGLKSMVSINHALKERRFTAKNMHFVSGEMIDLLNTPEKRNDYLREIEYEIVALHSNVY